MMILCEMYIYIYIFVPNSASLSTYLSIDLVFYVEFSLVTGAKTLLQYVNDTKRTLTPWDDFSSFCFESTTNFFFFLKWCINEL